MTCSTRKSSRTRRAADRGLERDTPEKCMPMLFSPTIGAAITARCWYLWVRCPAYFLAPVE